MITYAQAVKAMELIAEVERKHDRRKARIVAINEWEQPKNRKQRRIAASKARRKKNVSNGTSNANKLADDSRSDSSMGANLEKSE